MLVQSMTLSGPSETEVLGQQLAACLASAQISTGLILLFGDLGAGKSTLVRALLRAYGVTGPIPSPTYTLVEPYELDGLSIRHLDLYRIGDASELEELGGRELYDTLALVEWPDRVPQLLARADLRIGLTHADDGRLASLTWGERKEFAAAAALLGNLLEQSTLSS